MNQVIQYFKEDGRPATEPIRAGGLPGQFADADNDQVSPAWGKVSQEGAQVALLQQIAAQQAQILQSLAQVNIKLNKIAAGVGVTLLGGGL